MDKEQQDNLVSRNQTLVKENLLLKAQLQSLRYEIKQNPMRFFVVRDWNYGDNGELCFNEEILLETEL